jgi:hypothetical protein
LPTCPPARLPTCSYYWFTLALQFVALAGLTVLSVMGLLAASALSWMAWFTVLALLTIQGSDTFLGLRSGTVSVEGRGLFVAAGQDLGGGGR